MSITTCELKNRSFQLERIGKRITGELVKVEYTHKSGNTYLVTVRGSNNAVEKMKAHLRGGLVNKESNELSVLVKEVLIGI